MLTASHDAFRGLDRVFEIRDRPIELLFVDRPQNLSQARTWRETECEQVPPEQHRRGGAMLDAQRSRPIEKPVHRRAVECPWTAAKTVGFRQPRQELEVDFVRQPSECAVTNFAAYLEPRTGLQMVRDEAGDLLAHVVSVH